jgi:hypothetical protein
MEGRIPAYTGPPFAFYRRKEMQTDEMKYVLYLAVNQVNGKKYVGFTGRKLAVRTRYDPKKQPTLLSLRDKEVRR